MKRRLSIKKPVLKKFAMFSEKHLCWNLFFNNNAGLQACNFIKKRFKHRCFVNIVKFLGTAILRNIRERLFEAFLHD